jgi:nucleoside phosphorylase
MSTSASGPGGERTAPVTGVVTRLPEPRWATEPPDTPPTIGVLTATPWEFAAMRALLDRRGEDDPDVPRDDPAHYVLGSQPSRRRGTAHRVVLTQLGRSGTDAAANGCTNLLRSFPSVKLVFMVGTAAGIPNLAQPERHVRLGDIVVATQGVVDYDHVRVNGDGVQPRRQFPSPSPRLVRCADRLKADELSGEYPWERWLAGAAPANLNGYARPRPGTDVLHDHDGTRLKHPQRNRSGHRAGLPKVHYGLIGSANRSLRDAAVRDQVATRHGFLALDMESAGVGASCFLNDREWFVVRGVSDYADHHRNEVWRHYASLAAACYVRALLAECLPVEPQYGLGGELAQAEY